MSSSWFLKQMFDTHRINQREGESKSNPKVPPDPHTLPEESEDPVEVNGTS